MSDFNLGDKIRNKQTKELAEFLEYLSDDPLYDALILSEEDGECVSVIDIDDWEHVT